ncbi:hypothetical protein AURDEDRAFT_182382 [Auricularia subglabra TFB-10046 SS5]|nr:hypothetical protein AURDEDRAFT_182382 [Auricularia subglabra TFB-10046 SS5]
MSMTLCRIPLLVATAASMKQSFVRPNPAVPDKERQRPKDVVETMFVNFVSSLTYIVSSVSLVPAFCDICMILHASRHALPASCLQYLNALPLQSVTKPEGMSLAIALGATTAVAAASLRRWAMRTLGRYFTLELTLQPSHRLVTAAPYNIVRHPSYTGGLGVVVGAGLAFCVPQDGWVRSVWLPSLASPDLPLRVRIPGMVITGMLACIFSLGIATSFSRPGVEDRMLRERFGKDWDKWAARVPSKLIPGVF